MSEPTWLSGETSETEHLTETPCKTPSENLLAESSQPIKPREKVVIILSH